MNYSGTPTIQNSEEFQILYFSFAVRNTFHQNGIPSHDDLDYEIREIKFNLKKNEPTKYISWMHLAFFIDSMIFILIELSNKSEFKETPTKKS